MPANLPLPDVLRAVLSPRRSIAGRLARHYILATVLLLVASAMYLYFGLSRSLAVQDRALVASKIGVLRLLLAETDSGGHALASEIEHEAGEESVLKYYLRVIDADGRIVIETPGMSAALPLAVFPPAEASADPRVFGEREYLSNRRYLLAAAPAGGALAPRILQVALDVSHNEEILQNYRTNLSVALAAAVMLAVVIGLAVVRAGLQPLAAITRATQRITANHLDKPLSATQWPAELTALATEFDAMLRRLEDSFQRLSQCSADMAHALRNPINNLRGEAEVQLTRTRTPQEYQQSLSSGLEELDRLSRMIDGLLFIARADDVHAAVDRQTFEVRAEMDAVNEFYEALAAEKGVTVQCEGGAILNADLMLVRRAISNLLANALKYTPAGGAITLAARADGAGGHEIRVTDTGEGISREHLPRVFDRFFQVDKTRDLSARGAGLGLAIVQSIMRLHRGSAEIESEVGRGTRVILRFPGSGADRAAGDAGWTQLHRPGSARGV
ncbi:MAG: heavy metal sensor histidine kinase [Candidatus Didemnitutus sp.]|nr:heavy metal sensor histidine kinase [Candidatus Didemnitutus sp.]